jgi:prolyl-tRNA synthetase
VRWEMRTRPFLRTLEFLWQEGHTAHATAAEALAETIQMLDVYADFAIEDAAIPVIRGKKSEREKFAGAVDSYTIEAMMGNGWALQSGTSHFLGQNFAKAFDIKFLDQNNETQHAWTTSWGLSTRMVGAVIMAHGDDQGLRLPPVMAPIQAVVVPIFKKDEERDAVMAFARSVEAQLGQAGIRVHLDAREELTPGFKFNDWEMRGVPVRVEIGPRDVQQNAVVLARRDSSREAEAAGGPKAKLFGVPADGVAAAVQDMLAAVQANLLAQATDFRDANTHTGIRTYGEFQEVLESRGGFLRVHWAGSSEDEDQIKADTKATIRCYPLETPEGEGTCFYTGQPTGQVAIFARAY